MPISCFCSLHASSMTLCSTSSCEHNNSSLHPLVSFHCITLLCCVHTLQLCVLSSPPWLLFRLKLIIVVSLTQDTKYWWEIRCLKMLHDEMMQLGQRQDKGKDNLIYGAPSENYKNISNTNSLFSKFNECIKAQEFSANIFFVQLNIRSP